jgi:lysyl-tRNA synthetase, class II
MRGAKLQVRVLGLAVVAVGLLDLLSRLVPPADGSRIDALENHVLPALPDGAAGAAAVLGVILIVLGRGLLQRRTLALPLTVVVLGLSAATRVPQGPDIMVVLSVLVAILLIRARGLFVAETWRGRGRTIAHAAVIGLAVDFAYGSTGLLIARRSVTPGPTFRSAFAQVANGLLGWSGPLHVAGAFGHWFLASLTAAGAITFGSILLVALAPADEPEEPWREREDVRRLLQRTDGDTLDPFVLRRDKRHVFSSDGHAALGYRAVLGVGLASGDPVGDSISFGSAIASYVDRCDQNGWRIGVLGVREDNVPSYRELGLRAIHIGDEAVIDVGRFSLEGRRMRKVRQSVSHTYHREVTTEIHREGSLDAALRASLLQMATQHRNGAVEHGFSMALDGLMTGRDADCVVVIARDADGRAGGPVAFQRYVPCKAGTALSLDAMRRAPGAPNGINERMIVDAIEWARANDAAELSLNFAAFRKLMEAGPDLTRTERIFAWFIRHLSFNVQVESLVKFNSKFRPRWVPRYLVYRSAADLPAILTAILSAEGYLPFDRKRAAEEPPVQLDPAVSGAVL